MRMMRKPLMHESNMLDQGNNLSECADDRPEAMSRDLQMSQARDPDAAARRTEDDLEQVHG